MDTQPVMYDAPTSEKVVECVAVGFAVFSVWNLALLLRRAEAPFGPAKALSWLAQTIALVYHLASIPRLIELFTGTSRIVSGTAIFGLLWLAFMIPPTCLERVSERIGIELRSWQRTALVVVAVVIPLVAAVVLTSLRISGWLSPLVLSIASTLSACVGAGIIILVFLYTICTSSAITQHCGNLLTWYETKEDTLALSFSTTVLSLLLSIGSILNYVFVKNGNLGLRFAADLILDLGVMCWSWLMIGSHPDLRRDFLPMWADGKSKILNWAARCGAKWSNGVQH